jgi:hypothetical protein
MIYTDPHTAQRELFHLDISRQIRQQNSNSNEQQLASPFVGREVEEPVFSSVDSFDKLDIPDEDIGNQIE